MGINGYFISVDPDSFDFTIPFLLAGGIKIVYDVVLGCCFFWGQRAKRIEQHFELAEVETSKEQSENKMGDEIKVDDEK